MNEFLTNKTSLKMMILIKLRLSFICFNGCLKACCGYMRSKSLLKVLIFLIFLLSHFYIQAKEIDTAKGPNPAEETDTAPKISNIERSVMPATQWLERKIQNRSVIQPSIYIGNDKNDDNTTQITLREAIEEAKKEQVGTVLSAKRITNGQKHLYEIKILSESGIIKIIEIEDEKGIDE